MNFTNLFTKKPTIDQLVQECISTPNAVLLDVRTKEEYEHGHIPSSINIPLDNIAMIDIDKKSPLFVYCLSGGRSSSACSYLKQNGYNAINIGGIASYTGKTEKGV